MKRPKITQYKDLVKISADVNLGFKNQGILKYYPYGPETQFSGWLCGDVDLRKVYKEERNLHKTEMDYVFSIIEETARAMAYLTLHGNESCFDRQRIEAFTLWRLFHNGWMEYSKKPLKGKTPEEAQKIIAANKKKSDLVYANNDKEGHSYQQDKETAKYLKTLPKAEQEKYEKADLKHKAYLLKHHGVYEVIHYPLIQFSNCTRKPKVLYTKQQLAAIDLYVAMAFENLC